MEDPSALIFQAIRFVAKNHRDQRHKDHAVSLYIIHSVTVSNELTQAGVTILKLSQRLCCTDTLEDTQTEPAELTEAFGERVCSMVQELTGIPRYCDVLDL